MSIQIVPKAQQGYGAFNGGEIVENKPIGFPQDNSSIRPYSNLFYWAHARAVVDSTIGLHPHKGFEICSFVLSGEIKHFDTKMREWRPLYAGDVQIIRAGSGISHSEFIAKDGEIFQIWFDPNLEATLEKPASYNDYKASDFPVEQCAGVRITTLAGEKSPFSMDTPGVRIWNVEMNPGAEHKLSADTSKVYSLYLVKGKVQLNDSEFQESDFSIARDQSQLVFKTSSEAANIFIIESPLKPGYATYGQLVKMR